MNIKLQLITNNNVYEEEEEEVFIYVKNNKKRYNQVLFGKKGKMDPWTDVQVLQADFGWRLRKKWEERKRLRSQDSSK